MVSEEAAVTNIWWLITDERCGLGLAVSKVGFCHAGYELTPIWSVGKEYFDDDRAVALPVMHNDFMALNEKQRKDGWMIV